ncbi:MAG: class I SAM-dependent methyltransferase [Acidobacteria bacterium]|nr:class I SAM-dependent methyltransferase [Acidobacteriota bacterium]MBI3663242.1 class I SAM-dependent methyltransferase [Acidobacteriota bacterium]
MAYNAQEWDDRYRQPGCWAGAEPAEFLRQVMPLLPRGLALDIASGEGRNAVFLAGQGWPVFAIERSRAGLEKAEALARERGVGSCRATQLTPARMPTAHVALVEADLESFSLPVEEFEVVLCFNYLQRPLLPLLERALRRRGMLVYETYTLAQQKFAGGPRNPEFLLRAGELREAFRGMEILFYSEISAGKGTASLLARKA